jgi:tetratricopeptide (TPR) repeat protein
MLSALSEPRATAAEIAPVQEIFLSRSSGLPSRRLPVLPWRDPHSVPAGQLKKYIATLEQLCEIEPSSSDLRTCLGIAYAMDFHVYKSMDALERAIDLDAQSFIAQIKYAELLYRLRALPSAEQETLKALELCQEPWELMLARRQLQEIRRLWRDGTQKPAWTKSLTLPAVVLLMLIFVSSIIVRLHL